MGLKNYGSNYKFVMNDSIWRYLQSYFSSFPHHWTSQFCQFCSMNLKGDPVVWKEAVLCHPKEPETANWIYILDLYFSWTIICSIFDSNYAMSTEFTLALLSSRPPQHRLPTHVDSFHIDIKYGGIETLHRRVRVQHQLPIRSRNEIWTLGREYRHELLKGSKRTSQIEEWFERPTANEEIIKTTFQIQNSMIIQNSIIIWISMIISIISWLSHSQKIRYQW